MSGPALTVGVAGVVVAAMGLALCILPPTGRLAHRVRPYTVVARARLRGDADVVVVPTPSVFGGPLGRIFGPPLRSVAGRVGALIDHRDDATLALALRQAGLVDVTPTDHRAHVVGRVARASSVGALLGALGLRSAPAAAGLGLIGAVYAASTARGRIDRAVRERAERMRLELYTVNQLLAMHIRTGAGPIQAVQRVVDRGDGAVVDELAAVLLAVRRGQAEPTSFRHAADVTAEPAAARTYKLFAVGAERGVDLAGGLRALSEDLRDSRREEIRTTATKRRAAMLIPTIAVLAPVMLLFIAAPLPSVVFGAR